MSSRSTFAQAFNVSDDDFSTVGRPDPRQPRRISAAHSGAASTYRTAETQAIVHAYIGLAVALAVIAGVVWMFRNELQGVEHEHSSPLAGIPLLRRPRFGFGALCIFLYVGAEVSIGSLIVNYLKQPSAWGTDRIRPAR